MLCRNKTCQQTRWRLHIIVSAETRALTSSTTHPGNVSRDWFAQTNQESKHDRFGIELRPRCNDKHEEKNKTTSNRKIVSDL